MAASTQGNNSLPKAAWERLICPACRVPLVRDGERLRGACGHRYPIVAGVPMLAAEYVETERADAD